MRLLATTALALVLLLAGVPAGSAAPPGTPRTPALAPALAAAPAAAPDPEPVPQLRREGRWLVDQYGRVVIVRGVNLVWKRAPYAPPDTAAGFTTEDADWLADHGFNGARLGTLWAGVTPKAPGVADTAYFERWQRVMDDLAERRIWMVMDFHQDQWNEIYGGEGAPAWAVKRPWPYNLLPPLTPAFPYGYWTPEQSKVWDNFWAGKDGLLDAWALAWKRVAERWRNQPYSAGYELINEPWAGGEWLFCLVNGCPDSYKNELMPAYRKALARIREADPDNIVWFSPQQFAGGTGSETFLTGVPGEDQLGLSWHNYCSQVFFESAGLPFTNADSCKDFTRTMQTDSLEQAERMEAVGLMTEFGATDNEVALRHDTAAADEALTGWIYWAYKRWDDPTTADDAQGLFRDDADRSTTKPKVRTLVRTYPQSTCGTPRSLSFDPGNGDFAYTYDAGACDGQPTEIFVSPLHYPDGYDIDITGGTVVGEAEHNRILVEAEPGATVSIAITRKG